MRCWPRLMRCTANIPPPIDDLHLAPGQRFRPSGANQPGAGWGVSGGLMRVFLSLLLMLALAACQIAMPGRGSSDAAKAAPVAGVTAAPGTIAGGPIAVTPLAAGPQADAAPPAVAPDAAKPPTPAAPPKTPMQLACEKSGGAWSAAGLANTKSCIRRTRDSGQQCSKETDCEGLCLARSRTCAPVEPMFGCNDILQADGRQVTLCLD